MRSAPFIHGPLKAKGCHVCHRPANSLLPSLPAKHPMISKILPKDLNHACLVCHDEEHFIKARYLHDAIKDKGCTQCHDPHMSTKKHLLKTDEPPKLCLDCHKKTAEHIQEAKIQHGGLEKQGSCLNCHVAHHSDIKHLLKKSQPELCLTCHSVQVEDHQGQRLTNMAELLRSKKYKHKPIIEGKCSACHQPHGESRRRLLRKEYAQEFYTTYNSNAYELCFQCHDANAFKKPTTENETQFRNGIVNLHYTHVVSKKGRSCDACHDVHASDNPRLMVDSMEYLGVKTPFHYSATANGGSCTTVCHGKREYNRTNEIINPKLRYKTESQRP